MRVLVIGGSGSGKSAWAEGLVQRQAARDELGLSYIATMPDEGPQARERIERHRMRRAGAGFATMECYGPLEACAAEVEGRAVLLDCLGNATANLLFDAASASSPPALRAARRVDTVADALRCGLEALSSAAAHLVVVSNDVGRDMPTDEDVGAYIAALSRVSSAFAARADCVVEVVCGIACALKGELP